MKIDFFARLRCLLRRRRRHICKYTKRASGRRKCAREEFNYVRHAAAAAAAAAASLIIGANR